MNAKQQRAEKANNDTEKRETLYHGIIADAITESRLYDDSSAFDMASYEKIWDTAEDNHGVVTSAQAKRQGLLRPNGKG